MAGNSRTEFDVVIVGAGPVGLMAALACAERSSVLLVTAEEPRSGLASAKNSWRIESIPIGVLSLLQAYGVSPRELGVTRAFDESIVALNTPEPIRIARPRTAHILRPHLEGVLWDKILRDKRIVLRVGAQEFSIHRETGATGDAWHAGRVIDASGRAALTAEHVRAPPHPWVARSFDFACTLSDMRFRMAVLRDGYVYRLGAHDRQAIVFVGRERAVRGTPDQLKDMLAGHGTAWILDGLPSLAAGRSSTCPASFQMASSTASILIGDAAFARDILSSQGLACGLSDAMYAGAIVGEADVALFEQRKSKQRHSHLKEMSHQLGSHVFGTETVWAEYRNYLNKEFDLNFHGAAVAPDVVLQDRKLRLRSTMGPVYQSMPR